MDIKVKEEKLKEYANSVMEYPEYKKEIDYLLEKLGLSKEEVIKSYLEYDTDISAYENEIYEYLAMRMVLHLHYLLKGSWHQDRQRIVLEMVKEAKPKSLVDMGFGTPTRYIREYILKDKVKTVLSDLYESAFDFSKVLLNYLDKSWKEFISFRKLDMNTHEYPGNFDCYIFQDSIEHVKKAGEYLSKIVVQSPPNSKFIFSLPIGPLMECHTTSWSTKDEAVDWLKKHGLKIVRSEEAHINKDVDLFAEQIKGEFYNFVALCVKQ